MPPDGTSSRWTPALIVGILALFTGGLGGAVFTWWMNHKEPLVLGYVVTTTTTGTDATTKSLVPGLSLRIGTQDIPAIYTHVVSISRTSGYADSVDLAATFKQQVTVFGSAFDAPSPVHHIVCEMIPTGTKCKLGPLDGQGEFRLSLATDNPTAPSLTVAGRDVQLAQLSDAIARLDRAAPWWDWPARIAAILVWLTPVLLGLWALRTELRNMLVRSDVRRVDLDAAVKENLAAHAELQAKLDKLLNENKEMGALYLDTIKKPKRE